MGRAHPLPPPGRRGNEKSAPKGRRKSLAVIRLLAPAVFWLGVWQLAAMAVDQTLFLPSPAQVAVTLWRLAGTGRFWLDTALTLLRIVSGTVLGVAAGVLLATLTHISAIADALLSPAVRVLRAAPVVSFIILIILWAGSDRVPVIICAMMVTPVVWENLRAGLASPSPELLEMAKAYRMGRAREYRYIYLPASLPYLRSGVLSSIGLAWKSGVAAEVLCTPREAMGTQISWTKLYLEIPSLFAWTVVVVALSLVVERIVRGALERGGGGK